MSAFLPVPLIIVLLSLSTLTLLHDPKLFSFTFSQDECIDEGILTYSCDQIVNQFEFGCDDDFAGVSVVEACPVSCDSCPSSVKIKRRLPSPVEDIEEPEYSVFEGGMGLQGGEIGSVDYRDIYERLDEINERLDEGAMLDPGYIAYLSDKDNCETLPPKLEPLRVQLCDDVEGEDVDEECTNSTAADFKAGCVGGLDKWKSCKATCCREKWFPFEEVSRVDAQQSGDEDWRQIATWRRRLHRDRHATAADGAGEEGGAASSYLARSGSLAVPEAEGAAPTSEWGEAT